MGCTGLNGVTMTTSPTPIHSIISENKSQSEIAQCERGMKHHTEWSVFDCIKVSSDYIVVAPFLYIFQLTFL